MPDTNPPTRIRMFTTFVLLVGLCCALFTWVASCVLLVLSVQGGVQTEGLWLRILLFGGLSLGIVALLWRRRGESWPRHDGTFLPLHLAPISRAECAIVLPAMALSLLLTLPNLSDWPRAEPDETHHLIVAKNVAEYDRYASGNPEAGFKDFDPFDSIGPAGIVPVALLMKSFGASMVVARVFVALCLALLVYLLFLLYRPAFGLHAAWAVWLVPMTFSSVYLGRTFYGEVPAMMCFVLGLLHWRISITRGSLGFALLAGIWLGIAILVKSILLLSAFAFAVVWFHDLLTHRRIRFTGVVLIGIGVLLPLLAWSGVQSLAAHSPSNAAEGTVALYQHYLLFGVEPILGNLRRSLIAYPLAYAGFLAGAVFVIPRIVGDKRDPALQVLLIYAAFNFFWWLCFTPGQLPRYLWYSHAAAAPFVGLLVCALIAHIRSADTRKKRLLLRVAVAALLAPPLAWMLGQAREVFTNTEIADVRALAEFADTFPGEARIVTTHYPLEGNLSFLVDRYPTRSDDPAAAWPDSDLLITYGTEPPSLPGASARGFGVYWALYRQPDASQ